ncbi:hypothetical protein [Sphingomonas sp. CFBP 13720]|uniref:hypothetical protein n=1 Tax=Sphingomonas sp. CFBP 13720 TaxID=2775302 RepID=UPI00177B0B83|nr:hypothetical protein [Sphingomonas sp. CFBP 13720]MBD8679992.1 hypothetical protein [Sphingomonas sp. CFBP 13720]
MQDSIASSPAEAADAVGPFTNVTFGLIALLAVLTIIGIIYGMRLARRRRRGTRELEDAGHLDHGGNAPSPDPDTPADPAVARQTTLPDRTDAPVAASPVPAPVAVKPVVAEPAMRPAVAAERVAAAPIVSEPTIAPELPAAVAPPESAPTPTGSDLTLLKGLGPKVAAMLVDQGIADIAALARLSDAEADAVAEQLGTFAPRMTRDRWVEQARLLAAGDRAGFEARFGKL